MYGVLYTFGEIEVFGPQNPYPWLFSCYGNDCLDTAYYQVTHALDTYSRKPRKLTDKQKMPAQPTGPLKERVI